jgi:hypothetical protein
MIWAKVLPDSKQKFVCQGLAALRFLSKVLVLEL